MHFVMGNHRVFEQSLDTDIHGQQILREGHGNRSNHRLVREYAKFVQDELGDLKKAEEVYEQALQECPVDVDLVGGFDSFKWKMKKIKFLYFWEAFCLNDLAHFSSD